MIEKIDTILILADVRSLSSAVKFDMIVRRMVRSLICLKRRAVPVKSEEMIPRLSGTESSPQMVLGG